MSCDLCGRKTKLVETTKFEAGTGVREYSKEIELLPVAEVNKRIVKAMKAFRRGMNEPHLLLMGWKFWIQSEHAHECAQSMMGGGSPGPLRLFGVSVVMDPAMAPDGVRVLAAPWPAIKDKVGSETQEPTDAEKLEIYRTTAENLWHLLDNIDTLDDACKDDDLAFRNAARKQQQCRHGMLTSYDGRTLTWPWEPKPEGALTEVAEPTDG